MSGDEIQRLAITYEQNGKCATCGGSGHGSMTCTDVYQPGVGFALECRACGGTGCEKGKRNAKCAALGEEPIT